MNSPLTQALAGILILLAALKLTVVLAKPALWLSWLARACRRPRATAAVAAALATVMLAALLRSGLDIVQILATALFVSLLLMVGLAPHLPKLIDWLHGQDLSALLRQQVWYIVIWLGLLAWGAMTLLDR